MSIIIAVLMLGIIIMIHEFGHFLFAKLNGIGVIEFSLGMGPRLASFVKGGTRYSFKILPFGGSCMMLGEDENEADEHAFNNKSVLRRVSVIAAGPVFNFLLAFLLSLILVGATGYDTTGISGVLDGYPAQAAGMQAGDVIQSVNGRKVHSFRDINMYLFTHPQKQVDVTWKRTDASGKKQTLSAQLKPIYSKDSNQYMIGVQFDSAPRQVKNAGQLLLHGLYEVEYWIRYVFDTFYMMFHGLVSLNDISGPVGIVTVIGSSVSEASPYGLSAVIMMLLQLTILLSANLGVMNLLPIPALDGGRLVFLVIEGLRGKPIDKEKEGMVHMAGMMVLLALMVVLLFNDVRKLF